MNRWVSTLLGIIAAAGTQAEQTDIPKWGLLLPAISVATDYRFNGMSLSNREPVLQGSLHLWRPDGYFAGIWASQVDFLDGETTLELDTYAGREIEHGRFRSRVQLMYSAFNDDGVPGPGYDFFQLETGVRREFDRSALGLAALWSPSGAAGAKTVVHLRAKADHRFARFLKASTTVGHRWAEVGVDRSYWDAGLTLEWRKVDLDIRYHDTDLSRAECFYTDWCEAGIVVKLTLASY